MHLGVETWVFLLEKIMDHPSNIAFRYEIVLTMAV